MHNHSLSIHSTTTVKAEAKEGQTYFGNVDLNGRVVLGRDQSVSGRALSGNVEINYLLLVVLHICFERLLLIK